MSETVPATFADIAWGSNVTNAIAQVKSKGFTVLDKVSNLVRAEGKIFGNASKIHLWFDQMSLYKVDVYMGVTLAQAGAEYNRIASILSKKYGVPVLEETDGSVWENESTGGTSIYLTLASGKHDKLIGVACNSPELTLSEEDQNASIKLF